MIRTPLLLVLITICTLTTACGSTAPRGLDVEDARSRSTAPLVTTAVVYVNIANHGGEDSLVGGNVNPTVASSVTLHQDTMAMAGDIKANDADMSMMTPVNSIDLPPGKTVRLDPGGYHVMLDGLVKPLTNGSTFELTLQFKSGSTRAVQVKVSDDVS